MTLHPIGGCSKLDVEYEFLSYWVAPFRGVIDITYYDIFNGK